MYSHTTLPPLLGSESYSGLFHSCRQIRAEINHEATKNFRTSMQELAAWSLAICPSNSPAYNFSPSRTSITQSKIQVTLPFFIPDKAWYLREEKDYTTSAPGINPPSLGFLRFIRSKRVVQRGCEWTGETAYRKWVAECLHSLSPILHVHIDTITVKLEVNQEVAKRIMLETFSKAIRDQGSGANRLNDTPLGSLITRYIREFFLIDRARWNVGRVVLQWDFSRYHPERSPSNRFIHALLRVLPSVGPVENFDEYHPEEYAALGPVAAVLAFTEDRLVEEVIMCRLMFETKGD